MSPVNGIPLLLFVVYIGHNDVQREKSLLDIWSRAREENTSEKVVR